MLISSARYEGGQLILSTLSPDARKLVYGFKPGEYEITKSKEKRSLEANSKMWAIADKIAKAVGTTKEDVYRRAVREVGVFAQLTMPIKTIERFQEEWADHGTGWFAEVVDDAQKPGDKLVFAYYGSSKYDVHEMFRLLQYVIDDAQSLDIETLSPAELERLKIEA